MNSVGNTFGKNFTPVAFLASSCVCTYEWKPCTHKYAKQNASKKE